MKEPCRTIERNSYKLPNDDIFYYLCIAKDNAYMTIKEKYSSIIEYEVLVVPVGNLKD